MTATKRPQPYGAGLIRHSFKTTEAIEMGKLVSLDNSAELQVATGSDVIGICAYDDAYVADNETDIVADGDMAEVILFGQVINMRSAGTFDENAFVKVGGTDPTGGIIVGTGDENIGISLEAATGTDQEIKVLVR